MKARVFLSLVAISMLLFISSDVYGQWDFHQADVDELDKEWDLQFGI